MYCFHPIVIKRNMKEVEVPCGKCPACRRNYQLQWIIRLTEQARHSDAAYFVTLTYADDHEPSFDKKRVQKFLNRLQHKAKYHGATLKYFLVSEFCPSTGRPHHHAAMYLDKYLDNFSKFIADGWPFGFITVSDLTEKRINYVTGYCLKKQSNGVDWSSLPDKYNPDKCRLISRGLGIGYLSDAMTRYHKQGLVHTYGYKGLYAELPRYYKDKIFDEDDKEIISSTNRCYVRKLESKALRKLGLKKVTLWDSNKCCFYKTITTISDETPMANLVAHLELNEKKKNALLERWNLKMIHQ